MRGVWFAGALALLLPAAGRAADPSALWKIVNGQCVPHEQASRDPAPCAEVDLAEGVAKGFAVLKDIRGIAQYLLIPTARVSGIEDPAILAPDAPNYWDPAWKARSLVEGRLHQTLPRDGFALAINSAYGRTQDQLHIHIDCIRPDVRDALQAHLSEVGARWAAFPLPLADRPYRAIQIDGEDLGDVDPFRILADGDPAAARDMGKHTLVLVGETFADGRKGFVLLDGQASVSPPNPGSGEELEDHSCAIAGK
jgi:CDP-diacylglycerol pyrophosphatase